ncbi:hypothetical protein RchiOBHm_Chr3g0483181 [Rosa chinensis]|uniref:Uncharacterized protein n=1 Tax=Rosa chinensis TaxID=74649 RepID=A0A2P6REG0_ROSCH|nr:hypothetical protein RchiOBHm_Chr3g0483181 [Rosa chinensis]
MHNICSGNWSLGIYFYYFLLRWILFSRVLTVLYMFASCRINRVYKLSFFNKVIKERQGCIH